MKGAFVYAMIPMLVASWAHAAEGPFGLGVILGEPTGVSGKLWLGSRMAIDGAAAWSFADDTAIHLHGDYLVHFFDRFEVERGALPLYAGVGGRIKFGDKDDLIGVRFPLGVAYVLEEAPIDFFLEIVPILDLAPATEFRMNAAIGGRFSFGKN